ncbi:sigma 54-interacting transcriptional regulator [Paenibacillus pasadenensis]|uniref:sigma-54 interaction domain-containing protein n=1 Tax=Paenibacillus pasadenensis TaxID=217090 RepID=UPI00203B5F1F|nr:sigma 54-interacting transcriptional regulator [Paenibacillus pasadenensis]MCM3747763.1 sigma 54-interacting transcriptional regulator [Paenibacillus pasadenensis]
MKLNLPCLDQLPSHPFVIGNADQLQQNGPDEAAAAVPVFSELTSGGWGWLYYTATGEEELLPAAALPASMRLDELPELPSGCPWALLLDDNGRPVGCLSLSQTAAQLRQAFRSLRAGFEATLETTDSAVTVINAQNEVIAWTSDAERMFGIRREEIMGRAADEFFQKERLQVLRTLATGETVRGAQHQPRPDMHAIINARPVELDGERIGAVAAEMDVTSQIRLNQQLFQMTAKMQHLEREVAKLSPAADPFAAIKGSSAAVRATIDTARKISSAKAPVLILGESGVGKELYARAIHDAGSGPDTPFVAINCGAISPALFESELFGYEKGAFSGADPRGRKGKIDLAAGGTLFLDEIGEMPLELQVKLLRVLQEKSYYAVGGSVLRKADCRILAATNRNLLEMMETGRFREDLYYRLSVVILDIPPLRERTGDVYELLPLFLSEFALLYGRYLEACPHEIVQRMAAYDWPGNIRELRNAAERLVLLAADGIIRADYLPPRLLQNTADGRVASMSATVSAAPISTPALNVAANKESAASPPPLHSGAGNRLRAGAEAYEREQIRRLLEAERGNKKAVAKQLGISRATLYNRMKKLGIPL